MGGISFEDRPGVCHPVGISSAVLLEPEDEIEVFSILLHEEKPFLEILET